MNADLWAFATPVLSLLSMRMVTSLVLLEITLNMCFQAGMADGSKLTAHL